MKTFLEVEADLKDGQWIEYTNTGSQINGEHVGMQVAVCEEYREWDDYLDQEIVSTNILYFETVID